MSPVPIERERIVEAALAIIREGGWAAVSARAIAARLGASTMPIYSAVGSMAELKGAAAARAAELLAAAQRVRRTGDEILDLAVGYVAFAREEPRLFRFIGEAQRGTEGRAAMEESLEEQLATGAPGVASPALRSLLAEFADPARRKDFVFRSWVFTHGLAEMLVSGLVAMDDAEIARQLGAAGGAFYTYDQGQGGQS
jgi:AcrR family transcriptional regulator